MLKPMLAGGTITGVEEYSGDFPVVVSPKYDGYRCVTGIQKAYSRTLKPIPSLYVQSVLKFLPPGLDGELTSGDNFQSSCAITRISEDPIPFVYNVFDCFSEGISELPWSDRLEYAKFSVETFQLSKPEYAHHVTLSSYDVAYNLQELKESHDRLRTAEGVMIRLTNYPYESGKRSKSLIKVKGFTQSEAIVLEVIQEKYGEGLKTVPEHLWGTTKERASALRCKWLENGEVFKIGTGFNHEDKSYFWHNQEEVLGKIVTFKYLESGTKDKPRHPVFLGFRPEWDTEVA
jgi:DNA ligase-1